MEEAGKRLTDRGIITLIIREDDFDVKLSNEMTLEDLYIVCVSILQQLEEMTDESSCTYGSNMVQ